MKKFILAFFLCTTTWCPSSSWATDRPLFSEEELKELTYLKSHDYTYFVQKRAMSDRATLFFKNLLVFKQKELRAMDKWAWLEKEEKKELFQKLLLKLNEEK